MFTKFVVIVVLSFAAPPASSGYRPPLDRPVERGFDVSRGPFGAGNRGLDFAVRPGDPVGAIGPGTVVFAGAVAGRTWVTVLHPDGLRSSSGPLATVAVAVGATVERGDILGTTGSTFHLGVRRGDTYIDPATLFRVRRRHARLVPVPPRPNPPRNVVRDYRQTASLATRLVKWDGGFRGERGFAATLSARRTRSVASAERPHGPRRLIPLPGRVPGRF